MQRLSQPAIRWVLLVIGMATLSCGVLVLLLGPLTPSSQMAEGGGGGGGRPFTHYRLVI
jgi:hypothetical protein